MNVATFFELPQITDYPLSSSYYFQSYKELSAEVESRGEHFYFVRHQSTYIGNGNFSKSWRFESDRIVESGEVHADVIYDKGKFSSDETVPVLNATYINDICTDKWMMYQKFASFCPFTSKVNSAEELTEKMREIHTALAVIKPIDGEEGKDVFIEAPSSLLRRQYTYPVLLQEFIDTSHGIPGIVDGLHDFRIILLNGQIIHAYFRTPPKGSYLANVAQGGSQVSVDVEKIPEDASRIVLQIDEQLKQFKYRFYGIDLGFSDMGPKIIEMNSRLGLDNSSYGEEYTQILKQLSETLIRMGQSA